MKRPSQGASRSARFMSSKVLALGRNSNHSFLEFSLKVNLNSLRPLHPRNPVRVLIVDDDAVSLKSISTGLQRYGIEAFTAANGMQGFWLALKERPDVIFTDYHMANGDGRYLLGRIKSTPSTQRIPVVVFSARALSEGERSAVSRDLQGRGQAAGFLTKPISVSAFLKELRHHVSLPERADNSAFIELDCGR